jgi:aryl-alcohol dehydrogenase-like predicted oxidoreductase
MRYGRIEGVDRAASRIVMGTLGVREIDHANDMFGGFLEAGGNCFETAHRYGASEETLGRWVDEQGVRDEVVLITKGAHTPDCYPETVETQLLESLDHLRTDSVDLYFLHRDNAEVPVGEFVDVLDEHASAGRVRAFGGSNWSIARFEEANEYAAKHGRTGFDVLSNNFSLARMVEPPWEGCLASSDGDSRRWLEERRMALFPWSSQARGFFADGRADPEDRSDPDLARCWYSGANFQRLERARSMARERGVTATAVCLAYVLHQAFPCFPVIGPLSPSETRSSLAALDLELTPEEVRWLDLRE